MSNYQIEVVELPEKKFIGIPVTATFQNQTNDIGKIRDVFMVKRDEIINQVNPTEYVCPHFSNGILFSYLYCLEVSEIGDIPSGMIGFSIPSSRYVKVRSPEIDPYGIANQFIQDNGLEHDKNTLALEIFKFGVEENFNQADIFLPIK